MEEILFIDKPSGMTSHDVIYCIRRKTGIKRVGHAGTLDPLATGLLIVLVGRLATKRQSEFMKQPKEYICSAQLGVTTDTYDSEGQVVSEAEWSKVKEISEAEIKNTVTSFLGVIKQRVPAFSALKKNGKKLYQLARQEKISLEELPIREIKITDIELLSTEKNEVQQTYSFTFRVQCSSGTYVRSLVHDIGQSLEVGATVTALRRTKIGNFHIKDAQTLDQFRL